MANISIIRSVGGFVFDATFRESHTSEIEVTDNPVEIDSDVNDNMYVKPYKLTIAAGVSNSPLRVSGNDPFAGTNRAQAAFVALKALQASGEPFSIQTGLILYDNMMLLTIRATQDKDTDEVLDFEADFKGVNIVGTQVVTYPPRAPGKTTHQASKTDSKGEKQGTQFQFNGSDSLMANLKKFYKSFTDAAGGTEK